MNSSFNPGSIIFPEQVLSAALKDAVDSLQEADRARVSGKIMRDTQFRARLRKVISDLAISMMLAKSVDGERDFKSFAGMLRQEPERDEDCLLVAKVILGYSRETPEPQKGVPVFVKRETFLRRIAIVERNFCGESQ